MSDDNNKNSDKIEKIYRIIEFEIENANNQISLSKKDNINFILLVLALIGFFAFIPADTFFYQWIANSIYMIIILMGIVGGCSILLYYYIHTGKFTNEYAPNFGNEEKCNLCDSSTLCKSIEDPTRKEKIQNYVNSVLMGNISLFYSAIILTSFFFFISCMFPYFYLTASKEIAASFQNNALISLLLMLILLVYILLYIRYSTLLKKGNLKKYLLELGIFSIVILFCTLIIEIYGIYSRIPPFIPIANETQFSSLLIEHFKIIPSVPLSWIVMLYTFVISLALIELFFSSKYVENINKKLEELRSLKYRIDRYQLGISPELNFENILKTLSKQKIYPPSYFIAGGIISIPIPLSFSRCEETFYSALEDQTIGDMENSQK